MTSQADAETAPVHAARMSSGRLCVALILETSGGGSGRHVLDLAQGLALRGHHVSVIWSPTRAQKDFIEQLDALEGVENLPLVMHRAVGPSDVKSLAALKRLLRGLEPFDILHGHSSKAGALIRLLPKSVPGTRIYTPHAFRTMDPGLKATHRMIYSTIERVLANRAARIVVVSTAEHDADRPKADDALTFKLDHPLGALHASRAETILCICNAGLKDQRATDLFSSGRIVDEMADLKRSKIDIHLLLPMGTLGDYGRFLRRVVRLALLAHAAENA
jgi:glycosyltransferase involved in cell wall biosynthesis